MTIKFIGIKELRQNMSAITKQARAKKQRLIVLRKNEPIFELRPLSNDDAMLGKLVLDVQGALSEMKHGQVYSNQDIKTAFGLK